MRRFPRIRPWTALWGCVVKLQNPFGKSITRFCCSPRADTKLGRQSVFIPIVLDLWAELEAPRPRTRTLHCACVMFNLWSATGVPLCLDEVSVREDLVLNGETKLHMFCDKVVAMAVGMHQVLMACLRLHFHPERTIRERRSGSKVSW
jgi:hypothetical protein